MCAALPAPQPFPSASGHQPHRGNGVGGLAGAKRGRHAGWSPRRRREPGGGSPPSPGPAAGRSLLPSPTRTFPGRGPGSSPDGPRAPSRPPPRRPQRDGFRPPKLGGCLLHHPRPSSAAELVRGPREAGFLAAGAWRCRRAPGRGSRGTGVAEPPFGCAPSPSSGRLPALSGAGTPHPRRGHGRRRCLGTAPRWGPCAVPPHPVPAQHPPPPPASRGPSSAPHVVLTDQETYFNCRVKHKSLGSKKPRLPPTNQLEREARGTKDVKEN